MLAPVAALAVSALALTYGGAAIAPPPDTSTGSRPNQQRSA
jgi:hypothetical protein